MKTQTAKLNFLRIAPRKVRLVANLIKGMQAIEAEAQLLVNPKRAAESVLKLLRSAIANAKEKKFDVEKLVVKEIRVDGGPMLKRFMPRAQGRAASIHKLSSHITIILEESEKVKKSRFKIVKKTRVKKSEITKMKKEEMKHEKEHEHKTEYAEDKKNDIKQKEKPGVARKMFNRKAI